MMTDFHKEDIDEQDKDKSDKKKESKFDHEPKRMSKIIAGANQSQEEKSGKGEDLCMHLQGRTIRGKWKNWRKILPQRDPKTRIGEGAREPTVDTATLCLKRIFE